jgi:hypothetical protein
MIHLSLLLVGFALGAVATIAAMAVWANRHPPFGLTEEMVHLFESGLPETRRAPPRMPECKGAQEELPVEPAYMYGVTGEEV